MKKFLIAAAAAAALAVSPAVASGGHYWKLVAGTGQAPAEYAGCDAIAIYGFVEESQSWLVWFDLPETHQFLNDDFVMEPSKGYWVACEGES